MGLFTSWFSGLFKSTPNPVPVVTPDPVPVPVVPDTLPVTGTTIKIEDWNKGLRRWMEMPVPFESTWEMNFAKIGGVCSKERVTVLTGTLTVKSTGVSGPHNPSIKPIKGTYTAGQSFLVECSMGPTTQSGPSHTHTTTGFAVFTVELGRIIQLGALVGYP